MNRRILDTIVKLGIIAGCLWVIYTAYSVTPDPRGIGTHIRLGMEKCAWLRSTGEPCPTCGMTTSFAHTVRFQLLGALRASPCGMFMCLLTLGAPVFYAHSIITGAPVMRIFLGKGKLWIPAFVMLFVLSWFYKMWSM